MTNDRTLLRRLLSFVRPYRARLVGGALCLAVVSLVEPLVMIVFARIIDRAFTPGGGAALASGTMPVAQSQLAQSFLSPITSWLDTLPVLMFPALLVLVFAIRSIANFAGDVALHWVSSRVVFDLRRKTFAHLLRLPVPFFDRNATAELTSKLSFDAQQVGAASSQAITTLVQDSLKLLVALILLLSVSWQLTLGVFVVTPLVALVVRQLTKRLRAASHAMQSAMGELARFGDEALSNQKTVKVFSAFESMSIAFSERANGVRRSLMKQETANAASAPLTHLVVSVAIAIIIALAIEQGQRGQMSTGDFIVFFTALMSLLPPIKSLSSVNAVIQRGLAAASSLFAVLDQPAEPQLAEADSSQAVAKSVEFKNVCFQYADRDRAALDDVSFVVKPGEHVALVGASGSGKSTVLSLLASFYQPTAGEIRINDTVQSASTMLALRNEISLVSQDVLLVNASVARNIAFGELSDLDMNRVRLASDAAGATPFIEQLPHGFESLVGEGGGLLSGGQRQRIAIARAFYKRASIVLFDEASSALDSESEALVRESLQHLAASRTVFQVAHRLSAVRDADQILVFADGRIVERGTHDTLIAMNQTYADLVRRQAG
ncbi:MAG: ATP-binding cassette domain-containing protein [Betaproteobacteria bacterium]|nr:MAG: ATP-binding cassette domain-containing protein [Betaproteobacteria bacterium]TAG48540.1 MAG: ATP-binding cassette domain-containing protein [Betaproteobacteria bacterium]